MPPAEIVRKYTVKITGQAIRFDPLHFAEGKFYLEGEALEVRYELQPAATPKAIDFTFKEDGVEHRMLGIYATDGKQLKFCWQLDGKGRPTEFKTKDEPPQMSLTLKHVGS